MGKGSIPQPSHCPQKTLQYCTWPTPAPWGAGPAVSLVEAPGTEVQGRPRCPSSPLSTGRVLGLAGLRGSTKNASVRLGGGPGGPLPARVCVGKEEAGRPRAGGWPCPGPPGLGSHPPQEEVVGAVVPANGLAAAPRHATEAEVLVAVPSTDDQHFWPVWCWVSVARGVPVLQRR